MLGDDDDDEEGDEEVEAGENVGKDQKNFLNKKIKKSSIEGLEE